MKGGRECCSGTALGDQAIKLSSSAVDVMTHCSETHTDERGKEGKQGECVKRKNIFKVDLGLDLIGL